MICTLCSIKNHLHNFQDDIQLLRESDSLPDMVSQKLDVLYQDTKKILAQTEGNTLNRSQSANLYRNRRHFLLIINQSLVRIGVEQVLRSASQEAILDTLSSKKKVMNNVGWRKWDAVIADISSDGLKVLNLLKKLKKEIPVLVIAKSPYESYIQSIAQEGHYSCLTWENIESHLVEAIDHVIQGYRYIDPVLATMLLESESSPQERLQKKLSIREYETLSYIIEGKSIADIAQAMNISSKTVRTHRGRVLEKMKMKTDLEIIRYAFRHKLIE